MTDKDILRHIKSGLNAEINKSFDEEKKKALKRFENELEKHRNKYIRNVLDSVFITSSMGNSGSGYPSCKFDITIINNKPYDEE